MYIEISKISDINNIDEKIDKSYNGTCFAYSWFLDLKGTDTILKICTESGEVCGFMPLFNGEDNSVISQSTMYIPYGGFVLFDIPRECRNRIRFIRMVEKEITHFLKSNFKKVNFSTDPKIIDIMPFIRGGFVPELRYTYKIDLKNDLECICGNFGSDRKKDIRKAKKQNIKFLVDSGMDYFSIESAMKWEKKHSQNSTCQFVENYITTTIEKKRGMCFVVLDNSDTVLGGVHIAWDANTAYILYSYYLKKHDDVAIAFLYYKIFEYLKENTTVKCIDFEGSVFESIENWNISFGAYQDRFYNLHWSETTVSYSHIYDYGEK